MNAKRTFDFFVSISGLILLSPLLISIAVAVRVKLGQPILFAQLRPGLHGVPFKLYKFRTMTEDRDKRGKLLPDDRRLTKFGRFLRAASLDELPELWNIVKGEMSLVGPRPLLMQYLDRYTVEQARRHTVKPGLTGWAQVNGRNTVLFSQRLILDIWYLENQSFLLDLKILLLTIKGVLTREGIIVDQDVKQIDDLGLYDDSVETAGMLKGK